MKNLICFGTLYKLFYSQKMYEHKSTSNYMREMDLTNEETVIAHLKYKGGYELIHVPSHLRTEKMKECALENDGKCLEILYENERTPELLVKALLQTYTALQFILPNELKESHCLIAIMQNGRSLPFIPKKFQTEKICLIGVKKNGICLQFVIEKTLKICLAAVSMNRMAFEFVPVEVTSSNFIF